MADDIIDNTREIFLDQAYETLNSLDRELINLSKQPDSQEILNTLHANYKTFNDISKLNGFHKLASMVHIGEKLLRQMIDSEYQVTNEIITIILKLNYSIRDIVFSVDEAGKEPNTINASMIMDIEEVIKKHEPESTMNTGGIQIEEVGDKRMMQSTGIGDMMSNPSPITMQRPDVNITASAMFTESDFLDKLMNITIELIHTKDKLTLYNKIVRDHDYVFVTARLKSLISEMYDRISMAKSQPLSNLVNTFEKNLKEQAKSLFKEVELMIQGKDINLDMDILETLRESLGHLLKNSIVHGIESPDERREKGKPTVGRVTLKSFNKGETLHIIISDDGRGLDIEALRRKLVERDQLFTEEAESKSDEEIIGFILDSGVGSEVNTSRQTDSGNAGLDIVKRSIEEIGGKIYVEKSVAGKGAEFHITLPLINTIVPVIIANCGTERYAIAEENLVELLHISTDKLLASIEVKKGIPIYKKKWEKIPVVFLKKLVKYDIQEQEQGKDEAISLIILDSNGKKIAIVADSVREREEVVVKPLSEPIRKIYLFSGITLLSDEKPALILDITSLARTQFREIEEFLESEKEEIPYLNEDENGEENNLNSDSDFDPGSDLEEEALV